MSDAIMIEQFAKMARDELAALPAKMSSDPAMRLYLEFEMARIMRRIDAVLAAGRENP